MGLLWRLTKAAGKYGALYAAAIVSTLALALLNLAGPKVLSEITAIIQRGGADAYAAIEKLTVLLAGVYLLRVPLFKQLYCAFGRVETCGRNARQGIRQAADAVHALFPG